MAHETKYVTHFLKKYLSYFLNNILLLTLPTKLLMGFFLTYLKEHFECKPNGDYDVVPAFRAS